MKRSIFAFLLTCVVVASIAEPAFAAGAHFTVRLAKPDQFVRPDVRCLRFSPDGTRLAVAHSRGTTVIRTGDGEVTAESRLTPETLAWSRDGSKLLFASHKERWLIDTAEGTGEPVTLREERGFIGLRLEQRNGKLLLVEIVRGSPLASVKGIHVGDELIAIGHGRSGFMHSVIGKSVADATQLLAGPVGTSLRLSVIPHGQIVPATYEVVRYQQTVQNGRRLYELPDSNIDDNVVCLTMNGQCQFISAGTGAIAKSVTLNGTAIGGLAATNHAATQCATIRHTGVASVEPAPQASLSVENRVRLSAVSNLTNAIREDVITESTERDTFAVDVFDIVRGTCITTIPVDSEPINTLVTVPSYFGLTFAENDRKLVTGTWSMLHVYDVDSGQKERVIRPPQQSRSRPVESFAVSDRLAAVGSSDGTVWVFEFATGDLLRTVRIPGQESVKRMTLSPDSRRMAFGVRGVVHLVDLSDLVVNE
ncbi:MAG: hypothetical protein O3B13_22020 [Planctomycetota bacterium]|nr:hypothetical protein [Planctomycetota bacterium]